MKSKLIIVGGFLGAGKTSLLWETAKLLGKKGKKVGLISNDQVSELVDTAFLETSTKMVKEVSGSCFCCNFNGFTDAIHYIRKKNHGGIIIAEPVGSCTDLSATLMQPIKERYYEHIDLRPLTVLADPFRLKELLKDASSSASYIMLKQFEEADIILINKIDLISEDELSALIKEADEKWQAKIMTISVKTGEGLPEWLDLVLSAHSAGDRIAEVDYDIYADGEAAFGWLNASFLLDHSDEIQTISKEFLDNLIKRFEEIKVNVGHVKFLVQTKDKQIIGNITGTEKTSALREIDHHSHSTHDTLTVNARVEMSPEQLQQIVLEEVERAFSTVNYKQTALNCLIPGRPNPTHRYDEIIG